MYAIFTPTGTVTPPTSNFNVATFGPSSTKIAPIAGTYSSGYLPGQGFPAENENYLMYHFSNAINQITYDLYNIHSEILTVLSSQSIATNNTTTQLNTAIQGKINTSLTPYAGVSGYTASNSSGATNVPKNNGILNSNLVAQYLGISSTIYNLSQSGTNYIPYANSVGSVGIGTTSPGGSITTTNVNILDLSGKATNSPESYGLLVLSNNKTVSPASVSDVIGSIWFMSIPNGISTNIRRTAMIGSNLIGSGGANGFGGELYFGTKVDNVASTLERMRITKDGFVGIGTTDPGAGIVSSNVNILEVAGKGTNDNLSRGILILSSNRPVSTVDDTTGTIAFSSQLNGNASNERIVAEIESNLTGDGGPDGFGGSLSFRTKVDNVASTLERMRITSNGKVGIGVTDPQSNLEVLGDIRSSGISPNFSVRRINGTRTSPTAVVNTNILGGYWFDGQYSTTINQATGGASIQAVAVGGWSSVTVHPTDLYFSTSPASGAITERMRITSDGYVGIGTTLPGLGIITTNINFLEVSGKGTASASSRGYFIASNNRSTANVGDVTGTVAFASIANGPTSLQMTVAEIESKLFGAGGANGFGGDLYFRTKSDNLASITDRMRITSSGRILMGITIPTDDNTNAVQVNGSLIVSSQLKSTVITGTAPLTVASTTLVTNLNADMVDGASLSTDTTMASNSDTLIPSQKVVRRVATKPRAIVTRFVASTNQNFAPPLGAKGAIVYVIGAGGGGSGGWDSTTITGSGGGGGVMVKALLDFELLGITTLYCGVGGGGSGGTNIGSGDNPGGVGGSSFVRINSVGGTLLVNSPGGYGGVNIDTAGAGGNVGVRTIGANVVEIASNNGGSGGVTPNNPDTAGGGGGGGGCTGTAGGTASGATPGSAGEVNHPIDLYTSSGGGSSSPNSSTPAKAPFGGGGAGGGSGSFYSGRGGDGGDGIVIIDWIL